MTTKTELNCYLIYLEINIIRGMYSLHIKTIQQTNFNKYY